VLVAWLASVIYGTATVLPGIFLLFPQSAQRNGDKEVCYQVLDDTTSLEHCELHYLPIVL